MRHAQRLEDRLASVIVIGHAAIFFDYMRQDQITGIGIRMTRARLPAGGQRLRLLLNHVQHRQLFIRAIINRIEVHIIKTRGVLQQMHQPHRVCLFPFVGEFYFRGEITQFIFQRKFAFAFQF